jgi:hypothetical protein
MYRMFTSVDCPSCCPEGYEALWNFSGVRRSHQFLDDHQKMTSNVNAWEAPWLNSVSPTVPDIKLKHHAQKDA